MKKLYLFLVFALITTGLMAYGSHQLGVYSKSDFLNAIFTVIFCLSIAGFVIVFRKIQKENLQKKEETRHNGFGPSGGVPTGTMFILLISPDWDDIVGFFIVFLVLAGVATTGYIMSLEKTEEWRKWSPLKPSTWWGFFVGVTASSVLMKTVEVSSEIIANISTASFGMFLFNQKPYTERFHNFPKKVAPEDSHELK